MTSKRRITAMIASNLPMGAKLSSSAAIEVYRLRVIDAFFEAMTNPETIAKLARKAENTSVGMPRGIMDQFAVHVR